MQSCKAARMQLYIELAYVGSICEGGDLYFFFLLEILILVINVITNLSVPVIY